MRSNAKREKVERLLGKLTAEAGKRVSFRQIDAARSSECPDASQGLVSSILAQWVEDGRLMKADGPRSGIYWRPDPRGQALPLTDQVEPKPETPSQTIARLLVEVKVALNLVQVKQEELCALLRPAKTA
jgi:hypothetical protein